MEKPAENRSPATTSNTPATAAPDVLAVAVFTPRRVSFPRRALVLYLIWGLLIVLIGAEVGYLVSYFGPAKYGARSEVYFQLDNSLPAGFLREDRALATQLVTITSRQVLLPVSQKYNVSVKVLAAKVHASVVADSEVLRIEVDDPSRARAKALVASVTTEYLKVARVDPNGDAQKVVNASIADLDRQRADLEAALTSAAAGSANASRINNELTDNATQRGALSDQLTQLRLQQVAKPKIEQLTQPYVLDDPVSPKPLRAAIAGALAGLAVVALGATFLIRRHLSDQRN
jgi:capsular polysaccharide biosynthesis protein